MGVDPTVWNRRALMGKDPADKSTPEMAGARYPKFLDDIPVEVVIELGRTRMVLREIASLSKDDVIELDQPMDQPLDLVVSGKPIAQGELVKKGNRVALRITSLTGMEEGEEES